jgi:hypothetical protein
VALLLIQIVSSAHIERTIRAMDFAQMGSEIVLAKITFAIDAIAPWLWAGEFGFVMLSAHVVDPFLRGLEGTWCREV